MLITGFAAGMFATNCYVVAPEAGASAVIIDPGQDAAPSVRSVVAEHGLVPVAVLLTHGHLDHTWNAFEVCEEFDIPAYIHAADRGMLTDPASGIGPAMSAMIGGMTFREPATVIEFVDRQPVTVAGIEFEVDLAPGHTRGSVLLTTDVPTDDGPVPVCFSGDVLFAGSIGRTDLPGGNHQQLLDSIAERLLTRPDSTQVLPGHGTQTSVGAERASNPFLVGLPGVDPAAAAGRRKGRNGL
ncbi:MBL fold metallo-hydrolase [Williamsia sp. CHRR-6]|uniref:MBL fold metallo-hydrolase n=1 Tax=Williamsia sp. CHRR-6 TaxID=2835871 RepID=UPI001BDA6ADE|nr:MBL fold metallo-hydrolase [Williamsia sp. CHRR-6]MBT0567986.1 MBL fold metallo-hydrolase [Williamsia sp. CHRR-6]